MDMPKCVLNFLLSSENTLEALLNHWKELWLNAIVCNVIKGLFTRDEFELEFSGSSRAVLWKYQAKPSRGTLIFELKPSWQYRQYVCWKIANICNSFFSPSFYYQKFLSTMIIIYFMFNFMNLYMRIGIFGVEQ